MANPTTNYGWPMPTSTDLVTDLPADFAAFGQPVDTSLKALNPETTLGDIAYRSATSNTNTRLGIGTNGQVLSVVAGVPAWTTGTAGDIEGVTAGVGISGGGTSGTVTVTNSMATAITTAGDLIKGTGSGTFDRLGIGSTSQVLTVVGGAPAWSTPGGSSGPAFKAYNNADQNLTASTFTKVTLNTEEFDTAGNFASSRFTPTTAGYYQLSAFAEYSGGGSVTSSLLTIYKNGSRAGDLNGTPSRAGGASDLFYANGSTDYFEIYVILTMSGGGEQVTCTDAYRTRFAGVWIRG
jgi:hypothetical protein